MKNLHTLAGTILIMLCHGACRTSKYSNRQHVQTMATEKTKISSGEQENKQYSLSRSIIDSTGQEYYVTIFPADSFRFSVQEGFSGKATKIELRGMAKQLTRINDSATLNVLASKKSSASMIRKVSDVQKIRSRSVEKRRISWIWLCGVLTLGLLMLWVWKHFRLSRLLYSFKNPSKVNY